MGLWGGFLGCSMTLVNVLWGELLDCRRALVNVLVYHVVLV